MAMTWLAVYEAARDAVERARRGAGPTLIEAKTYRTVGHHEGDPVIGIYRTQEEVDAWAQGARSRHSRGASSRIDAIVTGRELADIDRRSIMTVRARRLCRRSPEPDPSTMPCMCTPIRSTPPSSAAARNRPARRPGSTRSATASARRCGATKHHLFRRGHRRTRWDLRTH